ncbi:MAG: hypothetical protein IJV39_02425 [Ruminococcus sp.]|nr:hypothetical protein [Ruminococcus sp.]
MKKKNRRDKYNVEETMPDLNTISSNDCTGLIPSDPKNDEQLESYEEIYPYNADFVD